MSLQVWLPLNGNLTNNGIDTITTSGTATYNVGRMGSKSFNLSSRVNLTVPSLAGVKTWSVAFWYITNTDTSLSSDWVDVLGFGDQKSDNSTNGDYRFEVCYGSTKNVGIGQYDNGTNATHGNFNTLVSTFGAWHHICITVDYENNLCTAYVDGVQFGTKTHNGGHLRGNMWLGQANVINGSLQDVRVYDHALSLREVNEVRKGLMIHLPLSYSANPNLAINSQTLNGFGGKSNYTGTNSNYLLDGERICKSVCTADSTGGPYASVFSRTSAVPAVNGTTYTWSCYIRGSREMTKSVGHECGGQMTLTITTEWQYVTKTWTYNTSQYQAIVFYGNGSDRKWLEGDWIEIKNFKIEEGSVATPYIPNSAEAKYTSLSIGDKFLDECSGMKNPVTKYGSNFTVCESPKRNNAITVGASSAINLGTVPKIQYPFSFAFWFKTSTLEYNDNRLISCTEGGGWNVEGKNDGICWTVGIGTSSNTYKNCVSVKTRAQLVDAWHHLVCTYDGLKGKMYIDGVLDKEETWATTATPVYYHASNAVFLAGEASGNATTPQTYAAETSLSDFRFYASILSAYDVKELYNLAASIDNSGKMYCLSYNEE